MLLLSQIFRCEDLDISARLCKSPYSSDYIISADCSTGPACSL